MKYRHIKKWILLAGIVLSAVASHFSGAINSYYLQIVIFIGINITLAISLNLINGYTGQFSLGHAGFMAIGAYVSAALSYYHGNMRSPDHADVMTFLVSTCHIPENIAAIIFFAGIAYIGGVAASIAG